MTGQYALRMRVGLWCGAFLAAAIALAAVVSVSARQASSPAAGQQPALIAHYPLRQSLFESTRTHSPLITANAPLQPERGVFCSGEYPLDWPGGCDVRTPQLMRMDPSSFTVSAEFLVPRRRAVPGPLFVFGQSSRWLGVVLRPDGGVQLLTNNSRRTDCSVKYRTGLWHEAAISFNGDTATLYLDGIPGCRAQGPLNTGNDRALLLTNYGDATTYYGFIRELTVYNGVVSPERKTPMADRVPAPEPAHVPPVDRFLATCPTAAHIAAVDRQLRLDFEFDATANEPLACRASEGSRDLSPLERRVYNTLLLMQRLEFDQPLPWTTSTLYRWLTSAIRGIRFRRDIQVSSCCSPDRVLNIANGTVANSFDRWVDPEAGAAVGLYGLMLLIVHEARHADGGPHTCGASDRTLEEMGSWGVQYHLARWLAEHTDQAFFTSGPRNYNAIVMRQAAVIPKTRICGK